MPEPFAVQVYRCFLKGKSIRQLSADLGISAERIEQRLRAAALYLERNSGHDAHAVAARSWTTQG